MSKISFRIDGVQWISGAGSQDLLIPKMLYNDRLYHAVSNNRHMWALIPQDKILNYLKRNNMNICEVLVAYPKKLYFDIDGTPDCKLIDIMTILYKYFDKKESNWSVSGYETSTKNSFHIVNNHYVITSDDEMIRVKNLVTYIKHTINKNFDASVYTKNRNMKCIYQSKPDTKNIQLMINDLTEENHLISSFVTSYVPISESKLFNIHNTTDLINKLTVKDTERTEVLYLPIDFSTEHAGSAKELLKLTPSADISHAHRWKVALFCYYNGLTREDYMEWFMKSNPSAQRISKVEYFYDYEIPKASDFAVSIPKFRKYLSIWYPELLEDAYFTSRFLGSFNLENTVDIKRIEPDHFEVNKKTIIFNIPMGGGKTTTTLQYLKKSGSSFIWLAPRQTLIANISYRLNEEYGIEHICHLFVGKDKLKLKQTDKLLICNQSLHYVEDKQKFDTVVIDEIETALNSWDDDETHKAKMPINFKRFCDVIQKAKKIILLDAFVTTKTIKFLNSLSISTDDIIIYNSKISTITKTLNFNESFDNILNKIVDDIASNKKLFIFYAFKNASEKGHYSIIQLDSKIKSMLEDKQIENKKSLLYYAESKEKNELGNVNEKWADADYVITTSSITVGVNYEGLDYDKVYLLCSGTVNNPRDIIQCSMRIRKPKENTIELFFFDLITKDFKPYPVYYHCDNNIYKSLICNVFAEQQADFAQSFRKFCDLTGYDYKAFPELKYKKKTDASKFVNDMFESRMLMEYSTIEVIDDMEIMEQYEEAVYNRSATLAQRFAVSRFYFDERLKELKETDRALIWNNRAGEFFKGINHPLIHKIKTENKVDNLDKLDLKKLEMSDGLKEDIKKYFSFDVKMKNQLIVKTINNLLGIVAIEKTQSSNGKHTGFMFSNLFNIVNDINTKLIETRAGIEAKFLDDEGADPIDEKDETGQVSYNDFIKWYEKLTPTQKINLSDEDRTKYEMYLLY